ncbi:hypothetical protein [Actinacidiphila sp. ITFR-21]|uniref:hypothetical protein n=1 Tax=Actinacidiphila sp. ITFR-21 TaxID=3075199 RepID=UPI0028892866|nr:hypothetical protein [Streptomyces sp. ITFR-21]WNI17307.1 hypothetical protein RLT57_18480 [Streptomyces sp. ITFR-21]
MPAQPPHDQHPTPSVSDVLASCAAARTVSTPPRDPARGDAAEGTPEGAAGPDGAAGRGAGSPARAATPPEDHPGG